MSTPDPQAPQASPVMHGTPAAAEFDRMMMEDPDETPPAAQPLTLVDLDAVGAPAEAPADGHTLDALALAAEIGEAAAEAESCATLAAIIRDAFAFDRIEQDASQRMRSTLGDAAPAAVAETQTAYTVASLRGTYRHAPAFYALGELADRLGTLAQNLGELSEGASSEG